MVSRNKTFQSGELINHKNMSDLYNHETQLSGSLRPICVLQQETWTAHIWYSVSVLVSNGFIWNTSVS